VPCRSYGVREYYSAIPERENCSRSLWAQNASLAANDMRGDYVPSWKENRAESLRRSRRYRAHLKGVAAMPRLPIMFCCDPDLLRSGIT
jgi:hypothetical protein